MAAYSAQNANVPAPSKDFYASYRANKYNSTPYIVASSISSPLPFPTAPDPSTTYSGAYSANVPAPATHQNQITEYFDTEELYKLPADPNRDWNKEFQVLYESPAATLLDREVYSLSPPFTLTF